MFSLRLLNNKILISVLLISFSSSLLSDVICDISHEKSEFATSGEFHKIENHSGEQETKTIIDQNNTDNCCGLELSIFITNADSNENVFFNRVLNLYSLNHIENEYSSEKELYSKIIGRFSSSPPKISNKIYRLNSLFLI